MFTFKGFSLGQFRICIKYDFFFFHFSTTSKGLKKIDRDFFYALCLSM